MPALDELAAALRHRARLPRHLGHLARHARRHQAGAARRHGGGGRSDALPERAARGRGRGSRSPPSAVVALPAARRLWCRCRRPGAADLAARARGRQPRRKAQRTRCCMHGRPTLPIDTGAPGYHRLTVDGSEALLIAAPPRAVPPRDDPGACWPRPMPALAATRPRSAISRTWRAWPSSPRAQGADFIGLSPLHAPFAADPRTFSPYTPSSRRSLNPLADRCGRGGALGSACRRTDLEPRPGR